LHFPDIPDLPQVPSTNPSRSDLNRGGGNLNNAGGPKPKPNVKKDDESDIDFDDLSRRFEDLKKRK
jgi:hypothetical protein